MKIQREIHIYMQGANIQNKFCTPPTTVAVILAELWPGLLKCNHVVLSTCLFSHSWCVLKLYFSKHRPSGPMLSISQNVRLSVFVFTFDVPFKHFFAPTSWSQMSKIFRDSESLGKSSEKKLSQIWSFWFKNVLKSLRRKSFFKIFFFLTFEVPSKCLFAPTSQSGMSKFFRDLESLGKSGGKKWFQFWTFLSRKLFKIAAAKKKNWIFFYFVHFWGTVYTSFCPHFPKSDV